ncbi:phage tail protein [Burkholderia ubonensis]|uniref:phage tail protein n=1 Tax=Burkholderia ubonensis TaxID=101571 RepID=UPI00075479F2|nr:phage tail protein [Burkholderia ubonensis]KWI32629.1 phage tail protein [Burkholderia ubonensis]KWK57631.1 phage tail protein [Burkholderia ubonensis]OJB13504.1 phage tail protein [Burkholderia ubonensis]
MADTAEKVSVEYPVPVYRFVVSLGDDQVPFKSVSGLDIKYDSIEYKDGSGNRFYMPGQIQKVSVTLSKGIFRGRNALYDWISSISLNRVEKKDLMISLTNESGSELLATWNVLNAFPIGLTAPSFDATSSEIAVQEITLEADRVALQIH